MHLNNFSLTFQSLKSNGIGLLSISGRNNEPSVLDRSIMERADNYLISGTSYCHIPSRQSRVA
jgi:hypothetical protein